MKTKLHVIALLLLLLTVAVASGCNLVAESALTPTVNPTTTGQATPGTVTPTSTLFIPTLSGQVPTALFPTSQLLPTAALPPTAQPVPIRVVIISPTPGSFLAGTISVFGSAIAPNFLQYQLEYGPEPNTANLWYPADAVRFAPVQDGLLGQWNTSALPDGTYTLRLRVWLRDGTVLTSSVNGLQIRNSRPTPQPSATPVIARPVAAFSQSATVGDAPLTVNFFNQSSGVISSFLWNFGDGTTSSEINPVKTYVTPSLYNVTLTVNGPGGSSNVTSQVNVRGPQAPRASFTANPTNGDAPLTVQFTDTSSGVISSWFWNFGNGQTSTERNPRTTFNNVGTFNVFLTVTGPGGTAVAVVPVIVRSPAIPPPVASFTFAPSSGMAPLTVQFNNTSSGNISSYSWNFGDGTSSNATSPVKVYQFPGTYTVTLLTFGPGGQAAATGTVTVSTPPTLTPTNIPTTAPPTATPTNTTTVVPPTATPTETATLTATNVPPTETPTETTTAVPPTDTPTETPTSLPLPTDTPTETTTAVPPTETPTETATPTLLPTDMPTLTPTAVPPTETPTNTPVPAPVAAFTAVVLPDNSLSVQFTNLSTGEGLSSFTWDFGDGMAAFEQNPIHTYATGGSFNVTLTATGTGGSNSIIQTVNVVSPTATTEPVQAGFTFAVDPLNPLSVQFTSTSTGPIASYFWTFGDGNVSNEQNPVHAFPFAGDFPVALTVTGTDGSTSNAGPQTVTVVLPTPTTEPVLAGFTFAVDPLNPLSVQFTSTSSGPIASYFWNLGDGSVSNEQNPVHAYAFAGDFQVALTVTGTDGSTSNAGPQTVTVVLPTPTIEPVQAGFTFAVDPLNPLSVQFTSTSTGPIASYFWNLGDGSVSNEQNPVHAYATAGSFQVALTVTSVDGTISNAVPQFVNIVMPTPTVEPVQANFTFAVDPLNPLSVQFTSTSTGPIASYFWNLGDGFSVSAEQNPLFTYAASGTYTVALTVTGSNGETNSTQQIVAVTAPATPTPEPVTADFTFVTAPDNSLSVQFTSLSTGPVASFAWDFGDGLNLPSTEQNPVYTYTAGGTFPVTLTVTAIDGVTTNSVTIPVTVEAAPTIAPFSTLPAPVFTLAGPAGGVYSVAYNPSFSLLAAGNDDGTVTIWNLGSQSPIQTLAAQTDTITAVSWSPDGSRLVSSSMDGTVVVFETAGWTPVVTIPLSASATAAAFSPNGTTIATAALDGSVQFWDGAGTLLNGVTALDEVYWLAWRPDSSQLAYTGREATVTILDAASATVVLAIPLSDEGTSVVWNATGGQILAGSSNGAAVYDSGSGSQLFVINDASGTTTLAAAWSPAGDRIAVGTADVGVLLVDAFSGALLDNLPAAGAVTAVAWDATNGQLAASTDAGPIEVWAP